MSDLDALLAKVNQSLLREDAQPFERIRRLGATDPVKVWHRLLAGDFMAECSVRPEGRKRNRRITATGVGLVDALDNLATAVADYCNPVQKAVGS